MILYLPPLPLYSRSFAFCAGKGRAGQTILAAELGVNASVVSRLEASEQADRKMAERYLGALKSDFANEIIAFFSDRWRHIERPDFLHPDRSVLWNTSAPCRRSRSLRRAISSTRSCRTR